MRLGVPEGQARGAEALAQRECRHLLQEVVLLVAGLQAVVGDDRTEVVDVVVADVAAEPAEEPRQLEIGATA